MKINNPLPLQSSPADRQAQMDAKLHDAAKMYEEHFLNEMVKAMRATVHHEDGFLPRNMAEKIFSEQLDQKYVKNWTDRGGIGLSDLIYNQLHSQLFPGREMSRPNGPLPLHKAASPFQIKVEKKSDAHSQVLFQGDKTSPLVQKMSVLSPWKGRIESAIKDQSGWNHVSLLHDNGLRSLLAFRGSLDAQAEGLEIGAGEPVGFLSPESPTLRWDVELA